MEASLPFIMDDCACSETTAAKHVRQIKVSVIAAVTAAKATGGNAWKPKTDNKYLVIIASHDVQRIPYNQWYFFNLVKIS